MDEKEESKESQAYAKAILISSQAAQIRIHANLYFIDEVIVPSLASAFMKETEKRIGKEKLKGVLLRMLEGVDLIESDEEEKQSDH